ncbi:penicillin-binding transpeptidase domain-containing protein [Solirubrobacter phytolaccae]|uniref:Penicillin-binding transpeptidase domain-containing protein n=1 Tax=Solirubrobacter phytolaccae TaxID=1404360 RepID=A0A9X3SC79_9ACTN|nr:penicillin-binding transpeptidase domain-containing protein [Solirubrobacter phytolaccae]MDA0182210.1 penicillin-binding transpeptidase domain-containing protein [Solirubrobacter phytolaccae]
MPQRVEDRVRPITPQLAWRVAVLGGIAFVLFAVVFFRLWYLQILTGDVARGAAARNGHRSEKIEAPRGDIVDRHRRPLVSTRKAAVVQLVPSALPKAVHDQADEYRAKLGVAETERLASKWRYEALARQLRDDGRASTPEEVRERTRLKHLGEAAREVPLPPLPAGEPELTALYRRIGRAIKITPETIHERVIRSIADTPFANVTVRTDVPLERFNFMRERPESFAGVVVTDRYVREYPRGTLAAQLFGTVSEITDTQLGTPKFKGVKQGTRIGQSGLEAQYDKFLRGVDGATRFKVDAMGARDDERRVLVTQPQQGQRLRLTLDLDLQETGERALAQAMAHSEHGARAGAFVAMDPFTGEVFAMGSAPSFEASVFARPFTESKWRFLTSDATHAPLLNRVTESVYPSASTFKPVTAFAALESGLITPSRELEDDGHWEYGGRDYQNAREARFGSLNVSDALKVSSDIFFFKLGAQADDRVIQRWAERFGYGHRTGIDLPGERAGLVPDRKWRQVEFAKYRACTERENVPRGTMEALIACGGVEKEWTGGDNLNLAVGQGDLQATPMQVAVAYAAIANGGKLVKPHLGQSIDDANGVPIQEFRPNPRRTIELDPRDRQAVLDGLRRAAREEQGTSADVFKGWPMKRHPVYGKTGTAERGVNPDQAWYACFVKDGGRPIVVVVTVERGGFGAATAAPAARMILAQWFGVRDRGFHTGTSVTR